METQEEKSNQETQYNSQYKWGLYLDGWWRNGQVFVSIVVSDGLLSYDNSAPKWFWHWNTSRQKLALILDNF